MTYAILTAKDGASVARLLASYGVAELVQGRVLDKETGVHKTHHLTALIGRLGVEPETITFVDDKVNHLERVAHLGVRCVLAGWGFNGPREHARAASLGFEVASLDSAETILLGGPP
jgi:phosphoglycolate phosphatase-like HAD superfamily hydrolase